MKGILTFSGMPQRHLVPKKKKNYILYLTRYNFLSQAELDWSESTCRKSAMAATTHRNETNYRKIVY